MEESKSNLTEVDWASHIDKCERSKLSMAKYCRDNGLVYESMRFRKAERAKLKQIEPKLGPMPFVRVQTEFSPVAAPKRSYPQPLPDPEWLARFFHTYLNCLK